LDCIADTLLGVQEYRPAGKVGAIPQRLAEVAAGGKKPFALPPPLVLLETLREIALAQELVSVIVVRLCEVPGLARGLVEEVSGPVGLIGFMRQGSKIEAGFHTSVHCFWAHESATLTVVFDDCPLAPRRASFAIERRSVLSRLPTQVHWSEQSCLWSH
jgi:hypothetical protein